MRVGSGGGGGDGGSGSGGGSNGSGGDGNGEQECDDEDAGADGGGGDVEQVGLHPPVKVFTCHLCPYSSPSKDDYNDHVNGHYDFRCIKCEFMTRDEQEYR